ncbi:hypothetical protein QJS83_03245 [Bdellovibrio sp. 22V]|uniref:DUF5602 domain-containing protein n=1 Tax=Bdellovibrio sp. 22V TaxID=3044166 RepID=UPI002543DE37|nr:DUF5602 domain-containing protein [Bdellovibrio sp. 22V]WII72885.1 hypothetical protein QJS83_03245 [Bdellovibrio sp. 22V]
MKILIFLSALFLCLQAQAYYIFGEAVHIGNGKAKAFADIDKYGRVQKVGMAMTEGTMQGLPEHDHAEYVLRLPSVLNIPPYNHFVINWEPHGHEPDRVYTLPHFDFHFYFITNELRQTITCMNEDRANCLTPIAANKTPPFYVPTPEGVPLMGWHWVDPRSPEFNGQIFTATYIYGFYKGEMTFVEPMVTREFLLAKTHHEKEVPLPVEFPHPGYYPQAYEVSFDSVRNLHMITLKNFLRAE